MEESLNYHIRKKIKSILQNLNKILDGISGGFFGDIQKLIAKSSSKSVEKFLF